MPIVYPLFMPQTPGVESVSLTAANSVGVSRSVFTYKTFIHQHAGASWAAKVNLPTMQREKADEWKAWLLSLKGQVGTFWLGDPLSQTPRGNAVGSPVVDGAGQLAGASTLATTGWSASTTGVLKGGDYIQVGQRLFTVLTNTDSDVNGDATIDIWPTLRESPANGETVITEGTVGLFRLARNIFEVYESRDSKFFSMSFEAVEAL